MGKSNSTTLVILVITFFGSPVLVILIAALLILTGPIVLLSGISGGPDILGICAADDESSGSGVVQAQATSKAASIPKNYYRLYHEAGEKWNIPWNVLAGIGRIESNHGRSNLKGVHSGENYAGAGGPMQFLQSTFDAVKEPGMSRYDPADAIFSAAKLLSQGQAKPWTKERLRRRIYSYNHAWWYVDDVLAAANRYAEGTTLAPSNYAGMDCTGLGQLSLTGTALGKRIANAAANYVGREGWPGGYPKVWPAPPNPVKNRVPYSWGGGDPGDNHGRSDSDGPSYGIGKGAYTYGFDCSGLARWAVYKGSGKKIMLDRATTAIWANHSKKGHRVAKNQLAAGDLVFFGGLAHMGVYYGKVNGRRWMVEAPHTGAYVQFRDIDASSGYVGALRISAPNTVRA